MPSLPTILLALSLPVGAVAYYMTGQVLMAMLPADQSREFIVLIVPLFVAGVVMMPFLIPFFDRKAKQDLAEHARLQAAVANKDGDPGPPEPGSEA
jgi:hypothetical protein